MVANMNHEMLQAKQIEFTPQYFAKLISNSTA